MNKPTDEEKEKASKINMQIKSDGVDSVNVIAQALADHRDQHDKETIDISDENVFFKMSDGEEHCVDELALSILLKEEILFCNERHTAMRPFKTNEKGVILGTDETKPWEISEESTTVLYVNCNDLFYWGTADAESLPNSEIGNLYRMWKANPKWGVDKWCCLRRKLRPQIPIVEMMKKDGFWDEELESLPAPTPS